MASLRNESWSCVLKQPTRNAQIYEMSSKIEDMLEWKGDYLKLESEHNYIQWSKHNQLRITRIIKSLGELGWKHLQKPWLQFMIREATINQVLPELNNKTTMDHFIRALKAKEDKEETNKLLAKLNDLQHKNTTEVDKNDGKVAAKSSYKDFKDDEGSEDNSVNDNEVTEGNENHEGVVGDEKSDQEEHTRELRIQA
ncbi:opioid growth factor receptor-like protein 1 [Mercenaria mercenaria]|uniref:opioid growth factor receptor-like protein 1 n=1 Tax=Mercenaria mercenaria TaxID=6596 RepID=UPI00234F0A6A|nr:opioid growth factor receptor-like protein 1 [Mercenaria mercenaria]